MLNIAATFAPTVALGKRHREDSEEEEPQREGGLVGIHTHEVPRQKRARGRGTTKGILKATGSAAKTHPELVARIPKTSFDNKPKAVGRGAERLATPSAKGVYHQPSSGPSFQRGWVVDAAAGEPTRVEGSAEGTAHHIDNTAQDQKGQEASKLFEIPRRFKHGYKMLLQASESDFARGAIEVIKCRVCPDAKFLNFQQFKRHCDFTEAHPLVIHFCNLCGNFFARPDALGRHRRDRPPECRKVTLEMAAQKHRETEEAHEEFIRRLNSGQDIGKPFSEIIKEKFPESSKKRRGGSK